MDVGAFPGALSKQLRSAGVVAVLVIDRLADAVPLANTLIDNGINAIELTLRTEAATAAIAQVRQHVPEMIVGAGTVTNAAMVRQVVDAGAAFGVAPGMNATVVRAATEEGLPFGPGVCTPSDIEAAVELGCRLLKFFPAEAIGGVDYLRAIQGPYAHLGLRFIPLGGINAANAGAYLNEASVHCIGGSWIAPRELIVKQQWEVIGERASQARSIVDAVATERGYDAQ